MVITPSKMSMNFHGGCMACMPSDCFFREFVKGVVRRNTQLLKGVRAYARIQRSRYGIEAVLVGDGVGARGGINGRPTVFRNTLRAKGEGVIVVIGDIFVEVLGDCGGAGGKQANEE